MSAEGNFEKTRIQDPDEAQEIANMLAVEAGEMPTSEDYDKALKYLDELQKDAAHGSAMLDKITKPLRTAVAGVVAVPVLELLALAVLNVAGVVSLSPRRFRMRNEKELIQKLKEIPENYRFTKENLATARERLEQWKEEASKKATK